jgi:nitrate/nitrite-specific signal transduction histidine kinase
MAEHKTFVRKHFFIDRRLQGRYMLTFLVPMLVMLLFMLFTLYFASQSMVSSTSRIIREDLDDIVSAALQDKPSPTVDEYRRLTDEMRDYVRTFAADARSRRVLLTTLMWVFGTGLLLFIVQVVLLTKYFSHKVAGPIYRLEKSCNSIIDGNYRDTVTLRKGDELQNLAALLNKALDCTRERLCVLRDEHDVLERTRVSGSLKL